MAGQPPEPSFQSSGEDMALTQGRPAWQASAYPPPAGGTGGQQGYGAQSYTPPGQSYPGPDQAYSGQDQTYTSVSQDYQGQGYQGGYQPPGYGAQPGQAAGTPPPPPQWQEGIAGVKPPRASRAKQSGEKGFVGSLLDFSFSSFVTPKIIKVLYVLFTVWTGLMGLAILIIGFKSGGVAGGLFVLIIIEPIFLLLTLGIYRVVLEAFMVVFRIYEEMKQLREHSEAQSKG
ncbi:MAG: DUF4282 domain-containing protein [Trebonia sp.]